MTRPDHFDVAGWTRDEALAAQAQWDALPRQERCGMPPIARWEYWHRDLPGLQREYQADGALTTLLRAVEICRLAHMPPPRWLSSAAEDLRERIEYGEYTSARALLALPNKPNPGGRARQARQQAALRELVERLEGGESMTAIKDDIGTRHGVAPDTLRNLFYKHRREFPTTQHLTPEGWIETRTGEPAPAARFAAITLGKT